MEININEFRKTDKKGIAALYDLLNVRKTLFSNSYISGSK